MSSGTPSSFQGIFPPASLKPLQVGDNGEPLPAFPGDFSPGLIEASARSYARVPGIATFPGDFSPGLIEARAARDGLRCRQLPFRGIFPPASLKQLVEQGTRLVADPFPGDFSPGLIEAKAAEERGLLHRRFPGDFSPGLIEASCSRYSPRRRLAPFRGIFPPASLKLLAVDPIRRATWAFRGIFPPASLKLAAAVVVGALAGELSGGFFPRPH